MEKCEAGPEELAFVTFVEDLWDFVGIVKGMVSFLQSMLNEDWNPAGNALGGVAAALLLGIKDAVPSLQQLNAQPQMAAPIHYQVLLM